MAFFSGAKRRQFERECKLLFKPLFHAAFRLARNKEWAEDLTQETLIRAYEKYDLFVPGTNFRAWLFTILTHTYLNDRDRISRRPVASSFYAMGEEGEAWDFPSQDASGDPQAALLLNILPGDLQEALEALPDEFRLVILLVDIEDMSYQDAALALKIPVGTVRSRVSRSRIMMRRYIEHKKSAPVH